VIQRLGCGGFRDTELAAISWFAFVAVFQEANAEIVKNDE
jgi:hypothetical protein